MAEPSPNPELHADLSGRRLGDYQVIRRLGQGGMAEVYLAQQQSLKRQVALKILKPKLAEDHQYVRRFQNEAQSAAKLVHANIVQIHEVGCLENLQFIAQEYVAGQNLKQVLDRAVSLDAAQATAILRQVAAALRKAGQHHIVHRDIKPENILINTDGVVKVADFGLARQNAAKEGLDLTQIGITMGTPLYMSPEQVEGRPLDSRTDIYSLGVTAYQMLAGHPPFDGHTPLSVALKHAKETPTPLSALRNDVPTQLCVIIHRMLEKQPSKRYETADELLRALDALPVAGPRSDRDSQPLAGTIVESSVDQPTLAETQELATVLAAQGRTSTTRVFGRLWPLLAATMIGAAIAWLTRGGDPLATATPLDSQIIRKGTAAEQLVYASLINSEEAFLSVAEYFPLDSALSEKDRLNVLRSKEHLAYWYLENDRPRDAIPLLDELILLDASQNDIRAVALARQARAYWQLGENEQAASVLASALTMSEFLDDPILRELEMLELELPSRLSR